LAVYLSEQMATRLAAEAERLGATRSGLVEAALERFLESKIDVDDTASVAHQLGSLKNQLEGLSRELRAVNEIVALNARFTLAMAPMPSAAAQREACRRGSARFDEFASQVERRMQSGTSLLQETLDRRSAPGRTGSFGVGGLTFALPSLRLSCPTLTSERHHIPPPPGNAARDQFSRMGQSLSIGVFAKSTTQSNPVRSVTYRDQC
jgi:predicted DNA-binding protein